MAQSTRRILPLARHFCQTLQMHSRCLEFGEWGDPLKVVRLSQRPVGPTGDSGVRLKLLASPINPADLNMIQGVYAIRPDLPAVAGNEGVAEVLEKGARVHGLSIGDWVIPLKPAAGTWQHQLVLQQHQVVKIRNDIPVLCAATLAVNPCTAYRMLSDFGGQERPVVQNGANSGVGRAAIQLARQLGIRTVNIVRDRPEVDLLKQQLTNLGADHVVTEKEFADRQLVGPIWKKHGKPLLALNCVGGLATLPLAACLDHNGKLVSYGGMSKMPMQVPVGPLIFKSIELHGFWISKWTTDPNNQEERFKMLDFLTRLMKEGKLTQPECETVTLDGYKDALRKSLEGFSTKQIFLF